jgi:hypothetical protein
MIEKVSYHNFFSQGQGYFSNFNLDNLKKDWNCAISSQNG